MVPPLTVTLHVALLSKLVVDAFTRRRTSERSFSRVEGALAERMASLLFLGTTFFRGDVLGAMIEGTLVSDGVA